MLRVNYMCKFTNTKQNIYLCIAIVNNVAFKSSTLYLASRDQQVVIIDNDDPLDQTPVSFFRILGTYPGNYENDSQIGLPCL